MANLAILRENLNRNLHGKKLTPVHYLIILKKISLLSVFPLDRRKWRTQNKVQVCSRILIETEWRMRLQPRNGNENRGNIFIVLDLNFVVPAPKWRWKPETHFHSFGFKLCGASPEMTMKIRDRTHFALFLGLNQWCGSKTFWCGSGSADPCLFLMRIRILLFFIAIFKKFFCL